jgi:hypothetical protein
LLITGSAQAKDIKYYGGDNNSYNFEMLRHVLSYQVDKNYNISAFPSHIPKQRAYQILSKNEGIDVVYGGATVEREWLNFPIRIPLLKGLNSWRIPLVKKSNANLIAQQSSLQDFKKLIAGQFHSWSDVAILQSNNVRVFKSSNANGIFQMLDKGRFDYFPRSVLEIWPEMEKHKNLDIMIEQHTFIHYPSAYYFYVNHQNQELINDIKQGLETALIDGSFDTLFNQHYGEIINKARQTPRKTYELNNPFLPPETPLDRKELWIDLRVKSAQ